MNARTRTGKTAFKDMTGLTFGCWTVIAESASKSRIIKWSCRCVCGTERDVSGGHLRYGGSKSCGCQMPKGADHPSFKHGMSETPEFKIWLQIHTRCYNENYADWDHYGGRGIRMCPEWKDDFLAFYRDVGRRPSENHSIDRREVNGDYEPGNCRWATDVEQARNTTRTRWVEYLGQKVCLSEACERSGIPYATAQDRIHAGRNWDGL